jgi:hypothetical protein
MCQPSANGFTAASADSRYKTEPHTKQDLRQAKPDTLGERQ